MTNKDLFKIFLVVIAAEAICHKPVKKNGVLAKVIRKLDDKGALNKDDEATRRLKAVIN